MDMPKSISSVSNWKGIGKEQRNGADAGRWIQRFANFCEGQIPVLSVRTQSAKLQKKQCGGVYFCVYGTAFSMPIQQKLPPPVLLFRDDHKNKIIRFRTGLAVSTFRKLYVL